MARQMGIKMRELELWRARKLLSARQMGDKEQRQQLSSHRVP